MGRLRPERGEVAHDPTHGARRSSQCSFVGRPRSPRREPRLHECRASSSTASALARRPGSVSAGSSDHHVRVLVAPCRRSRSSASSAPASPARHAGGDGLSSSAAAPRPRRARGRGEPRRVSAPCAADNREGGKGRHGRAEGRGGAGEDAPAVQDGVSHGVPLDPGRKSGEAEGREHVEAGGPCQGSASSGSGSTPSCSPSRSPSSPLPTVRPHRDGSRPSCSSPPGPARARAPSDL